MPDIGGSVLRTARLILRPPTAADFEAWAAFAADPEVTRFLGGVQSRSVAWRGFVGAAGAWTIQGFGMFSLIEADTGRWIGRVGPHKPEGWPGTEVGWGLVRDAWGKGYALEAAVASMDWAVGVLGWTNIIHCIEEGNIASQAVARRLGSTYRGLGRLPAPAEKDIGIWGQTADQWRSGRERDGVRREA